MPDVLTDDQRDRIANEIRRHPLSADDVIRLVRAAGAAAANGVTVSQMETRIQGDGGRHVFRTSEEDPDGKQ